MIPAVNRRKNLTICYFPGRESSYSRTRTIIKGMERVGIKVLDCSSPQRNFGRYWRGFLKFWQFQNQADIIFVGFFGHFLLPVVKILTRKKIMFDAFVSVYLTLVTDRGTISPTGILATLTRFIDKYTCRLADATFFDTTSQIKYVVNEYALDINKITVLRPGTDETVMYPRPQNEMNDFIVHFHGEFQTLHGANYILQAAQILPDIHFQLIGQGAHLAECQNFAQKNTLKNVTFVKPVPYETLPEYMARASVCLGIFGPTLKTQSVIPHKVFEAMAMAKAIITADTPAIRELLTPGENVYLCQAANAQSLAGAILELKGNPALREHLGKNAYKTFQEKVSLQITGQKIKDCALQLLASDN